MRGLLLAGLGVGLRLAAWISAGHCASGGAERRFYKGRDFLGPAIFWGLLSAGYLPC